VSAKKKNVTERDYAPNIFDVARLAGVSHQTVSRVVNDLPNVRASTKDRVEKAIAELGYRPSALARALVTRRSRTLGLLAVGQPDEGSAYVTRDFTDAARAAQYQVTVESRTELSEQYLLAAFERFLSQNVEAIVVISGDRSVAATAAGLDVKVPILVVDADPPPGVASVALDQYAGGVLATQHLIDLGHTRIAHLAGPAWASDATERRRGFTDTMTRASLDPSLIVQADWSAAAGFRTASHLLDTASWTGLFCANDHLALGAVAALETRGMGVPWSVSVVGFDDLPDAEFYRPALTTIRQDFAALGRRALEDALVLIDGGEPSGHRLPVSLIRRSSTRERPPAPR